MSKTRITKETGAIRIFDAEAMRRALRRIAHEIIERNRDLAALILAGIPARGVELARRIATDIEAIEKVGVATGVIDVSMHRDDVGTRTGLPVVRASQLPLPLEQRTVVIVDDVLFTGRTCRAAMDALSSFGRPACMQFAALIERLAGKLAELTAGIATNRAEHRTDRTADLPGRGIDRRERAVRSQ